MSGNQIWKCPLCDAVVGLPGGGWPATLPQDYFSKCKLTDHLIGIEYIAFRQETRARELLAAKESR